VQNFPFIVQKVEAHENSTIMCDN